MPWLETDPMNERKRFILEATGGLFSHTELCLRHGVSRKTGYKWSLRVRRTRWPRRSPSSCRGASTHH